MTLNKIYNEDCLLTMQRMPANFVDLVLTSPPYDNLRKYNGYSFDFEQIARELYRVMKPGAVIVWVVADATIKGSETGTSFRQALFFKEIGFNLHDTMIFAKRNYIPKTHNRYEQAFEFMFVFSKGRPAVFNPLTEPAKYAGQSYNLKRKGYCSSIKEGAQRRRDAMVTIKQDKIRGNIFYYSLGAEKVNHPAPFPVELAADQVRTWTNEGATVYDCFGGSGTTAVAAQQLNRQWILSEISQEYASTAERRLRPHLAPITQFDNIPYQSVKTA